MEIEKNLPEREKEVEKIKDLLKKEEENLEIIENKVHAKTEQYRIKKSEIEQKLSPHQ